MTGLSYHPSFRPSTRTIARRRAVATAAVLRRLDWLLLLAVVALAVLGSLLVYAATRGAGDGGDPRAYLDRHVVNFAIGAVLGAGVTLLDSRLLRAWVPVVYLGSLLGLAAVMSPLGITVNGSHSWISIGGFTLQPSEFAKVAVVVGMAVLLGDRTVRPGHPGGRDVAQVLVLVALPVGLIVLQPDLGTVMVITAVVAGVLAVSGVSWRWLAGLALTAVLGAYLAVRFGVLKEYQVERFAAFANPSYDPQGIGYNTNQARIAIGSGGLLGKGLFHGSQTTGQFVPEQQTDFIFSVAGEELGLLGAGAVIALLAVVLWRGCRIARRADDLVGTLIAVGVVSWFAFQAFENIGMTVGIMPVTGLPLPFVSYGGTATFANCIGVGLLENVRLRSSRVPEFD